MASGSKTVIYAALAGNTLIAVTKFGAAALTGSAAMVSEGIHSLVDTGNQALLLLGLRQARKPPDERFPFGHGKEVYFWSFVVAILIFGLGAGISIYEGVSHLLEPQALRNPLVNYVVLAFALLFEGAAWTFAFREFRKTKGKLGWLRAVQASKDPTVLVVLFEDSAAMLGLLIALIGVGLTQATGDPLYDAAASIGIGLVLAVTAAWLASETKGLLIGERARPDVVEDIRRICRDLDKVERVNEVLTMHMGPEYVLATLSLEFADQLTITELERTIEDLNQRIRAAHPEVKKVFIEAESWPARAPRRAD
ncbi:MAG: cation diffusion facilitator family transporter [Betaproteobacteria bacterium]|nr:cation diffusion facilitator family transporter [Betaproteobacteria bacterium]